MWYSRAGSPGLWYVWPLSGYRVSTAWAIYCTIYCTIYCNYVVILYTICVYVLWWRGVVLVAELCCSIPLLLVIVLSHSHCRCQHTMCTISYLLSSWLELIGFHLCVFFIYCSISIDYSIFIYTLTAFFVIDPTVLLCSFSSAVVIVIFFYFCLLFSLLHTIVVLPV